MTADERARVAAIRGRATTADTTFLLDLVEKIDGERAHRMPTLGLSAKRALGTSA